VNRHQAHREDQIGRVPGASRTSSAAAERSPIGSLARIGRAVISKLRCVCGECSESNHDCKSCSSVSARVPRNKVMRCGKFVRVLSHETLPKLAIPIL
jgi:hypothetical protein